MGAERIAWHPGFASAVQLELLDYQGRLTFETEHELNRQPLRIDLLVVNKPGERYPRAPAEAACRDGLVD